MANSGLQIVAYFLNVIGFVLTILATVIPMWKRDDPYGKQIETNQKYIGLWYECDRIGALWNCEKEKRFFLTLATEVQLAKGTMITASVLSLIAALLGIVGLECTKIGESSHGEESIKGKIGIVSGGLIVLSGLLVAIGINYYAVTVYQNFDGSMMRPDNGIHYIYGPCLIIGWVDMVVKILAGAAMIMGSLGGEGDEDGGRFDAGPYISGQPLHNSEYC